jgi:hypothetical protein
MALLMVAEFGAVTFVSPNVHVYQPLPTPTIDKLALPTVTLAPIVTAAPTQEEVLAPTLANIVSGGCEKDKIEWTFPVDGEKITGTVELKGTVNVQNIGFFKYEYAPVGTDQWTTIAAGNGTRIDQPLGGKWNTQSVNPGDYQLRIVVADNANNALPACVISVQITAQ